MADLEDLTNEDLIDQILQLEEKLEERESHIQTLEQENLALARRRGKGGEEAAAVMEEAAIIALENENEELREKLAEAEEQINKLTEKNTELQASMKIMKNDKAESDADTKRLRKKIEELERTVAETQEEARSNMRKSQESSKQKKDTQKQQLQLYSENETLREENKDLLEQIRALNEEHAVMESLIAKLADEKDQIELHRDATDSGRIELESRINELTTQLEQTQDKLQVALDAEGQWETELEHLQRDMMTQKDQYVNEIARLKSTIGDLEKQVAVLKDSTLVGEKQRIVEKLQQERKDDVALMQELRFQLEQVEHDKAQLAERLISYDAKMEEKFHDRLAEEREKCRIYAKKLESVTDRAAEDASTIRSLETQLAQMQLEIDDLNHWKVVYENNHGLQELTKYQKKMKEDNRRLTLALEQMSNQLSEVIDARNLLEQAYHHLAVEAGRDEHFQYPEGMLKEEMHSETMRLRSQLLALEEQIDSLENENIKLRKTLKNQAGIIGEEGFKYIGMTPDMLVKVNEFASNLREGKMELPLDNRSRELLAENKKLREDVDRLGMILQRLPASDGGSVAARVLETPRSTETPRPAAESGVNRVQEAEIHAMREDVHRLLRENSDLKSRLAHMAEEVSILVKQQIGTAEGTKDSIAAMLLSSNEQLMREIHELRAGGAGDNTAPAKESARDKLATPAAGLPPSGKRPAVDSLLITPMKRDEHVPTTPYSRYDMTQPTPTGRLHSVGTPSTPHGKKLLSSTVTNLNLPPEEWAEEVTNLNAQLIECVEQLFEREEELQEQKAVVESLEETLVAVKQQVSSLYVDYAKQRSTWEEREKQMKSETANLLAERDDAQLKLKRFREASDMLDREDASEMEVKLRDLTRRTTIYEVNEVVLTRKFTVLSEQLEEEQNLRKSIEADFNELEGTLKRRILQLEQYKLSAGAMLTQLQTQLDHSVPQDDYLVLQMELESLREDHLNALSREVEARIESQATHDYEREIRHLKSANLNMQIELVSAKQAWQSISNELEHEKDASQRAILAVQQASPSASKETAALVSEMAKFRGEAGRLEVELVASRYRVEALEKRVVELSSDLEVISEKHKHSQQRREEAEALERVARKECLEVRLKYEQGLTRDEADALRHELETKSRDLEEKNRQVIHLKEMAEIASQQVESMSTFRETYQEEIRVLREHCAQLESRNDDDLIIGRLQRQLMATKTSYKAFTRKYHILRANMRQRELTQRVYEQRLDEREQVINSLQQTSREEIAALKKALRMMCTSTVEEAAPVLSEALQLLGNAKVLPKPMNSKGDGAYRLSFNEKLLHLSKQVEEYAEAARNAENKTNDLEVNYKSMKHRVDDQNVELDSLRKQIADMTILLEKSAKPIDQKTIATRLITLSEETRNLKVTALQQKREIQVLQQEKKHLQHVIAAFEKDLRTLEESKISGEVRSVLMGPDVRESAEVYILNEHKPDNSEMIKHDEKTKSAPKRDAGTVTVASTEESAPKPQFQPMDLSSEELLVKLEHMNSQLLASRRDFNSLKNLHDQLQQKLLEAQQLNDDKDEQINYYERMASAEGLPLINGTMGAASRRSEMPKGREYRMMKIEQEKLQEAASATIGSMRSLLDEKNKTIEKYRAKLEALQEKSYASGDETYRKPRQQSIADRRAEDLLKRLEEEDRYASVRDRNKSEPPRDTSIVSRLMQQVETADHILLDKNKLIAQLEEKLSTQHNQRERAEMRCNAALAEMEAMKDDMTLLVKQLRDSEEKCTELTKLMTTSDTATGNATSTSAAIMNAPSSRDVATAKRKLAELQKQVTAKDEKVKNYRNIIVRLKEEFIKAEEERAVAALPKRDNDESKGVGTEELEQLRRQVGALRYGLRQAKEDLEAARHGREALQKARQAALEDNDRLEALFRKAESQATSAQNALNRCRRDLEESKRKEARLRERLREIAALESKPESEVKAADAKASAKDVSSKDVGSKEADHTPSLYREVEVLRVQNVTLRQALANKGMDVVALLAGSMPAHDAAADTKEPPKGNVLGGGDSAARDDLRQQLHSKWETEKKLQNRVTVLEKRLQEKLQENEELQVQLQRQREFLLHQQQQAVQSTKKEKRAERPTTAAAVPFDILGAEEANKKIFELEEEVQRLHRRAEVELANEILTLQHRCDTLRTQVNDMEEERRENEIRMKRLGAVNTSGRYIAQDSDDRFEENMRDELRVARARRLELEAAILDRDSRVVEMKFDLEAKTAEAERLRRRINELEAVNRAVGLSKIDTSMFSADERTPGGKLKRERDLEGVVETMKKVVDKLKAENDRLRKGGTGGDRAGELEKRYHAEKKKCEKLEGDLEALREKVRVLEDGGQKLVQRQQLIASLRKQLKQKDDELSSRTASLHQAELERDEQQRVNDDLRQKLQQLEMKLATRQLHSQPAPSSNELVELRNRLTDQAAELQSLKNQLAEAQMRRGGVDTGDAQLRQTIEKLTTENKRLKNELSAFDLEFFEEIENLKYAHAEAVRKLRMYEQQANVSGSGRR